jgi:hypothetical protein
MKNWLLIFGLVIVVLAGCDDDDVAVFEKTADERVAEAIANLKQELTAPENGWRVKYRPESESGSFYVLMDFNEDMTVNIKTDLGNNDGEFFEQTVTYRIDSSLGLELIIETYSFFSFLFEQNFATFLAEYEFNYINKTPDNALVFNSKTDPGTATILLFEPAAANDIDLLGQNLSANLNIIGDDFQKASSSLRIVYQNKDLVLYLTINNSVRILDITSASRKVNTSITQNLSFSSPFVLKGDSIVFDTRFTGSVLGNNLNIKGIKLSTLTEGTVNICPDPTVVHSYSGVTSANDPIALETSLLDAAGQNFAQASDFFSTSISNVYDNGESASADILQNLPGALGMQLYYDYDIGGDEPFYGIGFVLQNSNGELTFALREFVPTLAGNKISFTFAPDISIFGDENPDADINNINIYLDRLTEGDNTYVFKLQDGVYEFFNPCTAFDVIFPAIN